MSTLVQDIMERDPQVVSPNASLTEAAQLMRDGDFGALPVCDGERLQGMITDRDITVRAVASGKDINQYKVKDVMTEKILTCFVDAPLSEVEGLMGDNQVRRIPVLNREKKLVGIISLADMAKEENTADEAEQALHGISQPTHREPQSTRPRH
jgi:CBS domain-containing protein